MVLCGYLFDAIVISLNLAEGPLESLEDLVCELNFGEVSTKITASRINITEIPPDKSYEFEEDTENMRKMLSESPLMITLNLYEEPIGNAMLMWPEEVLKATEQMAEVNYAETLEIFADEEEEKAGSVDILIRFKPKCKNLEEEDFGEAFADIKEEILKELPSKDLFFVIEKANKLSACQDDLELEIKPEEPSMMLDMTQLRNFNGLLVPTPNMLNTCCSPDCCGLKKSSKKYGPKDRLVCGAVNMMKNKQKGKKEKDTCLICNTDSSESEEEQSEEEEEIGDVQWGGYQPPTVCLHTPPPELLQTFAVRPRCCPICNMNVDWLPSYTPCPKCGYKPVPKVKEMGYNEHVNADELLKEFYLREQPSDPIDCRAMIHKQENSDECDCECQKGNTCAHCKVRRACKNVFGKKFDFDDCGKNAQPPLYSEPLQRIFCELKDLLDRTDIMQMEEAKEECAQIFQNKEEKEIKRKIFGDANYNPCKELQMIKERFSKCKTIYPECQAAEGKGKPQKAPANASPCSCTKRKRKRRNKCRFPCGPPMEKRSFCVPCRKRMVPCRMGWLWTAVPQAKWGWRPGAVRRPIRHLMSFFLKGFPPDFYRIKNPCNRQKPQKPPKHRLMTVRKRNDVICVTLNPTDDECHPMFGKSKPIKFRIEKSDEEKELRKIRDHLLECYAKCTCLLPVSYCTCRDYEEKQDLELYLMKEGCIRNIKDIEEKMILTDELDSEAEYDFGISSPNENASCRKKKKGHNMGSQYDPNDSKC